MLILSHLDEREAAQFMPVPGGPNPVDKRLLALYPRWFAAMAAWDDGEGSMFPSFGTGKPARLRDMERIMMAAEGHGPIGAVIKLCVHRARMRTDGCSAASEAITLLARSMGIEPYGKEVST